MKRGSKKDTAPQGAEEKGDLGFCHMSLKVLEKDPKCWSNSLCQTTSLEGMDKRR